MGIHVSGVAVCVWLFVTMVVWGERSRLVYPVRALFHRRTQFRLPQLKALPEGITLRQFASQDREACLAIYKENEIERFPPGYASEFEIFLDYAGYLKLVLCENDVAVAIGGIGLTPYLNEHCAWLVFGLVATKWHGRGLGAALLLSRIASLPEPLSPMRLFMINVAKSKGYFERFGFSSVGYVRGARLSIKLPCNSALLDSETWRSSRERIASLGLILPEGAVPKVPLLRTLRARLSELDQAVLIQLAGLVALFIIPRPYNWMAGCILIVLGGLLYRQGFKRRKVG
jgi:hypothetical protein